MRRLSRALTRFRRLVRPVLAGPAVLAFLPAMSLGAYWLGGEAALIGAALGLPLLMAVTGSLGEPAREDSLPRDALTGLMLRDAFGEELRSVFTQTALNGSRSACFVLELDGIGALAERQGQAAADAVTTTTAERISGVIGERGVVARLGDARFGICLAPEPGCDLEQAIQLAGALHAAAESPVPWNGATLISSCALGFCLRDLIAGDQAGDWLEAAQGALAEARENGASGIRSFSPELRARLRTRSDLRHGAAQALENGQVRPWFQPQISTETGKVTGFEALARWVHPEHGLVPPDMFLPVMEEAGLMGRLGQVILRWSLEALRDWDRAGLRVPRVGVNFAGEELRNPNLLDKVRWELDRFDLTPDRLSVEILETVVTDAPDGPVTRNIAGLSALGCRIDLDDFGTGHASIASIRRFAVTRLKIDRGFVLRADRDRQQQRLIAAILTMAEQLGLETLAEGVETAGEHALLAQLGCGHVQGFWIGRPMPFEKTVDWIRAHEAGLEDPPRIGGGTA